ncbi:MAG TPA: YfiR family protein [Asticcacaulis sp.]|nr:YfiR family protein [Asticcacaulis sp.]
MRSWRRQFCILTVMIAAACPPDQVSAQSSIETAVKATYLYKFAPFVTWPDTATQTGPITICVVGKDPFGSVLDRAINGQTMDGRPFQINRVSTIGPGSTCNIAYLGGSAAQSVPEALRNVRGTPTLTVTDGVTPAGIIGFQIEDGRVRFGIDEDSAEASGIGISSKLLALATSVKSSKRVQP